MSGTPEPESGVWLCNGRLFLTLPAFDRYLAGCSAVALLARDAGWLLMPLRAGAGGLQVKLRNARGERVIEAQEFFRSQGMEDCPARQSIRLRADPSTGAWQIELG